MLWPPEGTKALGHRPVQGTCSHGNSTGTGAQGLTLVLTPFPAVTIHASLTAFL